MTNQQTFEMEAINDCRMLAKTRSAARYYCLVYSVNGMAKLFPVFKILLYLEKPSLKSHFTPSHVLSEGFPKNDGGATNRGFVLLCSGTAHFTIIQK